MAGLRTFDGAVALVTGAGSGIGEALAGALTARGAFVAVTDRRGDEATRVASAIAAAGGRAEPLVLDVRDAAAFDAVVADVAARHGRLDYLFNNAGIGYGGEVREMTLDDWRDLLEVNVLGVVHGVHAAYPRMVEQGFGHIVNTASVAGLAPVPMVAGYAMTKHAVVGLSRSLRAEGAHYGVRVSTLCPGVVRTAILRGGAFGRFARRPSDAHLDRIAAMTRAMAPEVFAPRVLRLVAKNRGTIVVPGWWRAVTFLHRALPTVGDWVSARLFRAVKPEYDRGARRA